MTRRTLATRIGKLTGLTAEQAAHDNAPTSAGGTIPEDEEEAVEEDVQEEGEGDRPVGEAHVAAITTRMFSAPAEVDEAAPDVVVAGETAELEAGGQLVAEVLTHTSK